MVLCGTVEAAELSNTLRVESKMADLDISGTAKARLQIWCMHRLRGVMQKLGQRGREQFR